MSVARLYGRHERDDLLVMSMELTEELLRVNTALAFGGDSHDLSMYKHHIEAWDARIMAALMRW